jgi:DNA-binding NtrC family response regulator
VNSLTIQALSEDAGWNICVTDTDVEMGSGIEAEVPAIIIYDRELCPDRWADMVRAWARQTPRPYIILLSPHEDANLWEELQRAGGSDVLRSPLSADRLVAALTRGWRLWRTQQDLRQPAPLS